MKLIVMIPCLNEELTLTRVIDTIPTWIPGIDCVETLIIDDGSTDDTVALASQLGVNHIVQLKHHMGLARAFQAGLDTCLDLGADVIVNTDGDNQYPSQAIPQLIAPILNGEADIVVGDRQTQTVSDFSPLKKFLQRFGSWAVKRLSGASEVKDVVSGFRAYSRYAASGLYLTNSFSYTIESLIQSAKRGLRIVSVPISTNAKTRPSRLFRSVRVFVARSGTTLVKSYFLYEPVRPFLVMAVAVSMVGFLTGLLFFCLLLIDPTGGHLIWLVLTALFLVGGAVMACFGLMADHIAANRKLLEELVWREKAASRGFMSSTLGIGPLQPNNSLTALEAFSLSSELEVASSTGLKRSKPDYQFERVAPDVGID
jgi:glycosyltransferase involved in cell wall biosynthesis